MFIVGLTGGIGSGKSAASKLFASFGVTIVDADRVAREVVEPGSPALDEIAKRFGKQILQEDKTLDRAQLRKIVFANEEDRKWLESVTHPAIRDTIAQRLGAALTKEEANYRILETPLLFESTQRTLVSRTCLIDVKEEIQIQRVMQRDNNNEAQVKAIIAAQMPRKEKLALADDVVDNNGSLEELEKQIKSLHQLYCELVK